MAAAALVVVAHTSVMNVHSTLKIISCSNMHAVQARHSLRYAEAHWMNMWFENVSATPAAAGAVVW